MTTSRIVRGTKGRVFLYICAVLFVVGLVACYNNVRVQLEETSKSFNLCRQEQEHLSMQLRVISDYKQRLESSLKTEKGDHQRTKNELESKFAEEKLQSEKTLGDSKMRFTTLQQQFNLLQTQHDDFKEESSKIQREQLDEINHLQAKLKEVQEQLKQSDNDKENNLQLLKTQINLLKNENEKLSKSIQLLKGGDGVYVKRSESSTTHFSKVIPSGDAHYVIPELEEQKKDSLADGIDNPADSNNVLAPPIHVPLRQSSTPSSLKSMSKGDLVGAPPLKSPTATPETLKKSTSKETKLGGDILPIPYAKRLPDGVVPVPEYIIDRNSENNHLGNDDVNSLLNNRYRNNIIDAEVVKSDQAGDKAKLRVQHLNDAAAQDNVAQEELDGPMNENKVDSDLKIKKHIDDLAMDEKEDADYDGAHLLEEGEDDDAVDGNPVVREPPAIRN